MEISVELDKTLTREEFIITCEDCDWRRTWPLAQVEPGLRAVCPDCGDAFVVEAALLDAFAAQIDKVRATLAPAAPNGPVPAADDD